MGLLSESVPTHGNWQLDDPIVGKRWSFCLRINENGDIGFHFFNALYDYDPWVHGSSMIPYEGQWVHVAATYDGSYVTIYINGIADISEPRTGPIHNGYNPSSTSSVLYISYIDYSRYFEGYIDEVKIYSCALTADEILEEYTDNSPI